MSGLRYDSSVTALIDKCPVDACRDGLCDALFAIVKSLCVGERVDMPLRDETERHRRSRKWEEVADGLTSAQYQHITV